MALSIKNAETERLARALAKQSGTPVTRAATNALEEAMQRARGRRSAPSVLDAILEVSDRCASLPDLDTRTADEILGYDQAGGFS